MTAVLLRIELLKLRGTLLPVLCILAPALAAVVALLIDLRRPQPSWPSLLTNTLGLWCYFVLPMTVAALAALLAQIEHGPRAWDHLFSLPISRAGMIASKAVTLMLLVGAMSMLLVALCLGLGLLAGAMAPSELAAASFPWAKAIRMGAAAWAASSLMTIIQLWIALRFRSFVVPIAIGLAGTFIVVAAMGAPAAIVLPWAMPLATLDIPGSNPVVALLAGCVGGLALTPLMAIHLARRDF